jgi:hypothetical protein
MISSVETGTILLKRRRIAKALRWWLRDNGFQFTSVYYLSENYTSSLAARKAAR